jgi:hypothetical protein
VALENQVAAIFHDSAKMKRIDFKYGAFRVSPDRLKGVGDAIVNGQIALSESDSSQLSAGYSPYTDKLSLPKNVDATADKWKVAILHEGVHALVDIYGANAGLTVMDDEAVAYLAEVIYYKTLRRPLPSGAAEKRIYTEADKLAGSMKLYAKTGVLVPVAKAHALRSAIVAHPAYADIGEEAKTGGHGLKRKCTSAARCS